MAGISAFGTSIAEGDTETHNGTTYTVIAQVGNISGPSLGAETIDVTAHDSSGNFREFVPSFLNAGEVSFDLNFDPAGATHTSLQTLYLNRTQRAYEITFTDVGATTWHFSAYVTGFEMSAPMDDKLSASVTLMITGAPEFS